ncbi:MAG: DUF4962 domain-containing protein [Candidatus Latescibacteria bacterium]|nr:DUF4962 domain-containing protein [Candidatus Latescibacterota bacterium]
MKEHRHPHPHVDPRQPRNGSRPGTNPPVFAWKPVDIETGTHLMVARDEAFSDLCLDVKRLQEPAFLPEEALAPGRYFWKWSAGSSESEVFEFEITPEAVVVEVPSVDEWLRRFSEGHPRMYIRPEDVQALRESRQGEGAEAWEALKHRADVLLEESHELEEPPFLPPWSEDYDKTYRIWSRIASAARGFIGGAETLALAYLSSGEAGYARAACLRMASVSRWDPEGSSHISHNDEAHMPVIWHGPKACDWAWDQFTNEELEAVIAQYRQRGQITFDHMHNRGSYGVTRFDSHAGREIVFLANTALVFHEHIPEARTWLEWLRPVLCGIWPIWAGDDGGWAEGPNYGLSYVTIMTMFATALKRGAGVDLYRRPFWQNHARWRLYCFPPYAECTGFGDTSGRSAGTWESNANLVETIGREIGTDVFAEYVEAFREEADRCSEDPRRRSGEVDSQRYLAPLAGGDTKPRDEEDVSDTNVLHVFPAAGRAAIRTDMDDPSRDVALMFRSSPYGAVSHSHADNNDFIFHVAGRALAIPSGYYAGYGSDHHTHWNWHTKSHNCVTLSDASQIMRSHDSSGAVENAFEDDRIAYFRGAADASYRDRAQRCRRHVLFLKAQSCFVMIDEFTAAPGIASALQWNLHSWYPFEVDDERRTFTLACDGRSLEGHFMYHHNAFFSLSEGWDPPPMAREGAAYRQQYHLRFTPSGIVERRNLGTVFCPGHETLERPEVHTERSGDVEVARVGGDLILVGQGGTMEYEDLQTDALGLLMVQGTRYEVRDEGIEC